MKSLLSPKGVTTATTATTTITSDPFAEWYNKFRSAKTTNLAAWNAIKVSYDENDGALEIDKHPYHFVETIFPAYRDAFTKSLNRHLEASSSYHQTEVIKNWAKELGGYCAGPVELDNQNYDDIRVWIVQLLGDDLRLAVVAPTYCKEQNVVIVCQTDLTLDDITDLWNTTILRAENTADVISPVLFGHPEDFDNSHEWLAYSEAGVINKTATTTTKKNSKPLEDYEVRSECTEADIEKRGHGKLHIGWDGTLYSPITGGEIKAVQPTILSTVLPD